MQNFQHGISSHCPDSTTTDVPIGYSNDRTARCDCIVKSDFSHWSADTSQKLNQWLERFYKLLIFSPVVTSFRRLPPFIPTNTTIHISLPLSIKHTLITGQFHELITIDVPLQEHGQLTSMMSRIALPTTYIQIVLSSPNSIPIALTSGTSNYC